MQPGPSSVEAADRLFGELYPPLMKDAHRALKQAEEDSSDYNRRVAFRVVFSAIEGLVWILKDHALAGGYFENEYSAAEIALLREEEYILNDRGKAITKTRFVRIGDNLLFAWNMYFRETLPDFRPDLSGDGWRCFSLSLATRNRITHPKSGSDLTVLDEDIKNLEIAFDWVIRTTFSNMASALLRMRSEHYERLNLMLPDEAKKWLDDTYSKMTSLFQAMKDKVESIQLPHMELDERIASSLEKRGLLETKKGEHRLTADALLYIKWRASRMDSETSDPV